MTEKNLSKDLQTVQNVQKMYLCMKIAFESSLQKLPPKSLLKGRIESNMIHMTIQRELDLILKYHKCPRLSPKLNQKPNRHNHKPKEELNLEVI